MRGQSSTNKNAGKSVALQRCHGKRAVAEAHPPAPSAVGITPAGHEWGEGGSSGHNLPVGTSAGALGKHIAPAAALMGLRGIGCLVVVFVLERHRNFS